MSVFFLLVGLDFSHDGRRWFLVCGRLRNSTAISSPRACANVVLPKGYRKSVRLNE